MSPRFVLLGHPVGHSLSPAIHAAAYRDLGLEGPSYTTLDCPDEASVRAAFAALRSGELAGANVTVPWKLLALALADRRDASAADVGAANVLRRDGAVLVAHNTDVPALAEELAAGRPGARAALVLGSGGAALAAVAACRLLGVEEVWVTARRFVGERGPTWERAALLERLGARPIAWPSDAATTAALARGVAEVELVVQSTSDGMSGASDGSAVRGAVPWEALRAAPYVYDLVYSPRETPLVLRARAEGLPSDTGLGMLVRQAALAVELWFGRRPSLAPLREAAEAALRARRRA